MTPELDAETGSLHERAAAILDEVDSQLASLEGDDSSDEALEAFRELGAQAGDLVSDSNPKALLESLDTDEDAETDYEELSLPAAMSKSDPESVIDLRTLLRLSNLPDADDADFSEHLSEIREMRPDSSTGGEESATDSESSESTDASAESAEPSAEGESASTDSSAEEESAASESSADQESDSTAESTSAAESEPAAESSSSESDTAEESESDSSSQVKQKLQEQLDDFRDGVRSYRESLAEEEADAESASASADADTDTESGMASSSSPGRRTGTRFSTLPSRSRVRRTGTTRFSTMNPGKNRKSD